MHNLRILGLLLVAIVAGVAGGCANFQRPTSEAVEPEVIETYSVLNYQLPFVYEEGEPRQEAFLTVIRQTIAPADWEKGPDSMTPIAHILVVSTTAKNHLRLKRFFDSLPNQPEGYRDAWTKPAKETNG